MQTQSDWYGGASQINVTAAPADLPKEQLGSGNRPVHFWLIMIALLFAGRVAYEAAGK